MPWGWGGRGRRNWFYATGMPGWLRASYGLPAYGSYSAWPGWGRGNPYPFCRWFPWLPRWWWSGIYGPVQWTPQGPQLVSQPQTQQPSQSTFPQPTFPFQPVQFPQLTKEQEIQSLEQELNILEQERKALEQEIQSLRERLNSLKTQK